MPREYYSISSIGDTVSLRREINRILDSISRRLNSISQDGDNISLGGRKLTDLNSAAKSADALRLDQAFLLDNLASTILGSSNITITLNPNKTITISANLSGIFNSAQAVVDFGFASGNEDSLTSVTVLANWVKANSIIICNPVAIATADHDAEDYGLEAINAYATNIVAGVSFDVIATAPNGTWGKYNINCIGV